MQKPRPSEEKLRALHQAHGGSIRGVANAVKRPYGTVRAWYDDIGMKGQGRGGLVSSAPPEDELRALYEKFGGHFTDISIHLGCAQSTVTLWYRKLGLSGGGRYGRAYPREVPLAVKDGYVVAFSDAHFWDEQKSRAHVALLALVKKIKPVAVIANGDVLDGARVSRHDPSGLDATPKFEDELLACQQHMAEIKRASGGAETFLCLGNHDARFSAYTARGASELLGVKGSRLDHHILGWKFCWSVRINNNLLVMHRFKGGQHATYNNTLRAGISMATGHLHSQRVYAYTDANGIRWGVDLGCLAEIHGPQFAYTEAAPLDWRSGFGVFEFRNGRLLPPQLVTVLDDGAVWWQKNERVI